MTVHQLQTRLRKAIPAITPERMSVIAFHEQMADGSIGPHLGTLIYAPAGTDPERWLRERRERQAARVTAGEETCLSPSKA